MFNTDSDVDIVLYSGEVLKFCKNNIFSQNCKDYYKKIQDLQTVQNSKNKLLESMTNKMNDGNLYTFIFYFILGLICVLVVVLFLNRDLTASKDIKQTNIETNTSNNINK